MRIPWDAERMRMRPLLGAAVTAAVVLAILLVVPLFRSGPEALVPQGGSQSLRPGVTITEADDQDVLSIERAEDDQASQPLLVDPETFLPPFLDSVIVADMDTICETPAPDNAIYVATDGDDSNPGTIDRPLATISNGVALAEAGQTVLVRGGEYAQQVHFRGKFGTPDAYITLRAYPNEQVKLVADIGQDAVSFRQGNAYINVACFEMAGPTQRPEAVPESPEYHRNRTLAGEDAVANPGNYGNGVSIGDRGDTRAGHPTNHHIRIVANDIHDFTAAGVNALESNHISVLGNRIYRNSKYSCYSTSGISFAYLLDAGGPDNPDGYSNYIVGNVSYENENRSLQCFTDNLDAILTDGNGIIIDENDTQGDAYTARTLVANNVTFGNGGRGILVFDSSRVDVVNNLSYQNLFTDQLMGRDGPHPEIAVANASDVHIYNNIAIPSEGNDAFSEKDSNADIVSNLFAAPGDGANLFEAPAIDGSGDFTPRPSAARVLEAGTPFLASPGPSGLPLLISPVVIGPVSNTG